MPASSGVTADLSTGLTTIDGDGGSDTLINIENLLGSDFTDLLTGNAAANTIDGGLGNDVIRGGGGADVLIGGDGSDQLRFDDLAAGVILDLDAATAESLADGSVDTFSEFETYFTTSFGDNTPLSNGVYFSNVDTGRQVYLDAAWRF